MRKGLTLLEVSIVIFVVSYGLLSVYTILGRGEKLAITTSHRIQAINIAREGIEAMINIRDTNWIRLGADRANCWKTKDYNVSCIGSGNPNTTSFQSGSTGSFIPYLSNGAWYMRDVSNFSTGVYFDGNGLPYQTGATAEITGIEGKRCAPASNTGCRSIYNRTIQLTHPTEPAYCGATGTGCLKVESIVSWPDGWSISTLTLETVLTNWRANF